MTVDSALGHSATRSSELAEGDLIEIGAHTQSHPVLAKLAPERQAEEIDGSKAFLEQALARRISSFAYPYGSSTDFDQSTVRAVTAAGFEHACTCFPAGSRPTRIRLRFLGSSFATGPPKGLSWSWRR